MKKNQKLLLGGVAAAGALLLVAVAAGGEPPFVPDDENDDGETPDPEGPADETGNPTWPYMDELDSPAAVEAALEQLGYRGTYKGKIRQFQRDMLVANKQEITGERSKVDGIMGPKTLNNLGQALDLAREGIWPTQENATSPLFVGMGGTSGFFETLEMLGYKPSQNKPYLTTQKFAKDARRVFVTNQVRVDGVYGPGIRQALDLAMNEYYNVKRPWPIGVGN